MSGVNFKCIEIDHTHFCSVCGKWQCSSHHDTIPLHDTFTAPHPSSHDTFTAPHSSSHDTFTAPHHQHMTPSQHHTHHHMTPFTPSSHDTFTAPHPLHHDHYITRPLISSHLYRSEEIRQGGFCVILDGRTSNWHTSKQILRTLQVGRKEGGGGVVEMIPPPLYVCVVCWW